MSHFLNREKFNFWIPKLITQADEEVILIVPYIKTSETVFNALKKADKDNKRIVIIYRENKLNDTEKEKLLTLKNLDLLHHPNIHCKCYYNGDLLIIGSMNLYEYSEQNNREMGVIFSCSEDDTIEKKYDVDYFEYDDLLSIEEPLKEIRQIVNGATLEKKSKITTEKGFKLLSIQTDFELALKHCEIFNKHFGNKVFRPILDEKAMSEGLELYDIGCTNYYDNIDVIFERHRLKLYINLEINQKIRLHNLWKKDYDEYRFKGFKHYWNWHTQPIYIYRDSKYDFWDKYENNPEKSLSAYKKGLTKVFQYYEKLKKEI